MDKTFFKEEYVKGLHSLPTFQSATNRAEQIAKLDSFQYGMILGFKTLALPPTFVLYAIIVSYLSIHWIECGQ